MSDFPTTNTKPADPWLRLAQDAFKRSTSYFDNNYRKGWEDDLRMFQSKHPRDSKYNSDAYKFRSRIFRPKSRSVVRKHEATAALAFFSNPDVVNVDPVNGDDPNQAASSAITKELLQYRLTKTIPWFLTVIGGFQDAMTVGLVASFQYWDYRTRKEKRTMQGMSPWGMVSFEQEVDVPYVDKPCCELIPIENIRFDPAAKWYDVVHTSPFLVVQFPMYVRDVLERMESGRDSDKWKSINKDVILAARVEDASPLRQARNDLREDPQQQQSEFNEFDVVMVHLNIIKVEDETFVYYTLKDTDLLSDPKPLQDVFLHGKIPITIGFCVLETHKPVPSSLVRLGSQLQTEANELVNQRLDNVKYVLNKRSYVRRGANVDIEGMLRNVPGGVTMVNDVERDIKHVDMQDVTSSAFAEQDRVNVDYDELLGNFAQSSVMTNRRMNETVGGMRIMAQGANALSEYTIRVFVETWMEPTLRQLVLLEQFYETDDVILGIAAQKAQLWQRYGMNAVTDRLLKQELTTSVNVGMGATDPDTRFHRFVLALASYSQAVQAPAPDLNLPEVRKELFGLAGFKDSLRFFTSPDPRLVQAQKMLEQAKGIAQQVIDRGKERIMRRERQLDNRETDLALQEIHNDAQESAVSEANRLFTAMNKLRPDVRH